MTLQIERLRTIEQLEAFVAGSASADCKPLDRESAYDFVRRTLVAFDYHRLGKADRGWVRPYVVKVTALSPAQMTRLVARHAETGAVMDLARATAGTRSRRGRGHSTYGCWPRSTRRSARCRGSRPARHCAARSRCTGIGASNGWRAFRVARLQPARVAHLPRQAHDVYEDQGLERRHRGAQGAGAERRAGLSAGRHRAPGRPGRRGGRPHRQPGGRGDPVRVRRRRAGHLGAVPDPGPGSAAADVLQQAPYPSAPVTVPTALSRAPGQSRHRRRRHHKARLPPASWCSRRCASPTTAEPPRQRTATHLC